MCTTRGGSVIVVLCFVLVSLFDAQSPRFPLYMEYRLVSFAFFSLSSRYPE